jgi:hypothetical protein
VPRAFTLDHIAPCRLARERPQLVGERTTTIAVTLTARRPGVRRLLAVERACREEGLQVDATWERGVLGVSATLELTGPLMTCARTRLALEQEGLVPDDGEGRRLLCEAKRDIRARNAAQATRSATA